ncbi:ribonuclease III [Halothermothrix orenii]|uniref:Ribonuclease 3 n=1 Tax=Halothermothrix orenii (strain H 168 / OCM 544 / DSM 9562) TaxID=373903 RepID=B8CWW9_HALOH|nr:ribonuclease III [Halothermothrix orenii]ACL69788.1 Ribonuclease III [Halothermothrix orenii H 168]
MIRIYNKKLLKKLEEKLNIRFNDISLLQKAVTHKSFVHEKSDPDLEDNERLEFLGDSVLSIVISTYLYKNFPEYNEGELAKMRAYIVSSSHLACKARELGLGKYILMGKGEELNGGRERESILADTLEAVIGAIYLDQGFNTITDLLINFFKDDVKKLDQGNIIRDYKTYLQEFIQKDGSCEIKYNIINEYGPDHNKKFEVGVKVNGKELGRGTGFSKKEAEQKAAKDALSNLGEI